MKGRAPFFFLLCSIPLCKCTIVFWSHSFADGHLGCFQYLPIVNCAAMNSGVHRFSWIGVSGFLGYNCSSRILGQNAVPFLVFWGNSIQFSTVASPVCIPTNSALGFPLLHILSNICLWICLCWPLWLVWDGTSLWFSFASLWWLVMLRNQSHSCIPTMKQQKQKSGKKSHLI